MAERYAKLFALPENLYSVGSPVVIAAGALLKDNQTGHVLAQLKLQNIGNQTIKAATVRIFPMDTAGEAIDETVTYQYLDLCVKRDTFFGQKIAIPLPNAATRSISVAATEVIFSDNTKWTAKEEKWSPLKKPTSINYLHDTELIRQFHLDYGLNSNCLLSEDRDLWICVCGAINHSTESRCHSCTQSLSQLKEFNLDNLRQRKEERLEQEKAAAEKQYIQKAKEKHRNIRTAKRAGIALAAAAIVCVAAYFAIGTIKKDNAYRAAISLMEQKKYEEAIEAFTALGNYKDSTKQIEKANQSIEEANRLLAFEEDYQHAIQLLNSDDSLDNNEAYSILCKLGSYKDAPEFLKGFVYRVISAKYSGSKNAANNGIGEFFYDDCGRLILETGPSWKHAYVYDKDGKLIKDGPPDFQVERQYDNNGALISTQQVLTIASSGKKYYLNVAYDESGYPLTVENEYEALYWVYQYQGEGDALHDSVRITIKGREPECSIDLSGYDCNKLCEGALHYYPTFWEVQAGGKQTSCYDLRPYGKNNIYRCSIENCEYDEQMNVIRKVTFDRTGKQDYEYHYTNTYDDADNLIKVEQQTVGGTSKVVHEFKYGYVYAPNSN